MNALQLHSLLVAFADAAFKSLALFALACLLATALRKRSAAARHLVWCAALGGALVLPALSLSLPHLRVPYFPRWANWAETGDAPPSAPIALPSFQGQPGVSNEMMPVAGTFPATWNPTRMPAPGAPWVSTPSANAASPPLLRLPHPTLPTWLALAWLAGTLFSLAPLLAGCWQISRMTRRAVRAADPLETAQLRELCAQLGLHRRVDLRRSSQIAMPLTWGAWRPVLLLPETFAGWSPERRQLVLLHELAHVQRWDWLGQIAGRVACALYWFNPLAWLAARQMRLEREQACDDLVLASGTAPGVYADELLQIATGMRGPSWLTLATVPMAHRSSLEVRLRAILDRTRRRQGLTRAALLAMLGSGAAIVAPLAMLHASAETKAEPPRLVSVDPDDNGQTDAPPKFSPDLFPRGLPETFTAPGTGTHTRTVTLSSGWKGPSANADPGGPIIGKNPGLLNWDQNLPSVTLSLPALSQPRTSVKPPITYAWNVDGSWQPMPTFQDDKAAPNPFPIALASNGGRGWVRLAQSTSPTTATPSAPQPGIAAASTASRVSDRGDDPMDVDYVDQDLRSVLQGLAVFSGLQLEIDPALHGKITLKLHHATWEQVFEAILSPLGYTFVLEGETIRVAKERAAGTPTRTDESAPPIPPASSVASVNPAAVAALAAALRQAGNGGRVNSGEKPMIASIQLNRAPLDLAAELLSQWAGRAVAVPSKMKRVSIIYQVDHPISREEAIAGLTAAMRAEWIGIKTMDDGSMQLVDLLPPPPGPPGNRASATPAKSPSPNDVKVTLNLHIPSGQTMVTHPSDLAGPPQTINLGNSQGALLLKAQDASAPSPSAPGGAAIPVAVAGIAKPASPTPTTEFRKPSDSNRLDRAKAVVVACLVYANAHNGFLPKQLADLLPDYAPKGDVFNGLTSEETINGYDYLGSGARNSDNPGMIVLVAREPSSDGRKVVVLLGGGVRTQVDE